MRKHAIPVDIVHIDGNPQAREAVMALNHGYASVPTLLFPDGTQLTEPSLRTLRRRLGIASPTLLTRLGAMFRRALCD